MEARLPVMVSMSLALHAGGLGGWLYLQHLSSQKQLRVISNVDLIIQMRKPVAVPVQQRKLNTWNFLKMALPSVPKVAAPLEVKSTEVKKKSLVDIQEKLKDDKGRVKKNLLDEKLVDQGRTRKLAQLDAGQLEAKQLRASLAQAPKLEEVGVRRASRSRIEMAEIAEERRGRLQALESGLPPEPKTQGRSITALAPLLPQEAASQPAKGALSKMADMLTSDAPLEPRTMDRELPRKSEAIAVPALPERREASLAGQKKKSVEIEGPLKDRKVVYYELPEFPGWAADQGILEADVRLFFYVAPSGGVMPSGLRIERTSGYGALDRLALDSLRRWRFQALSEGSGNQWGIITFRFVLQ